MAGARGRKNVPGWETLTLIFPKQWVSKWKHLWHLQSHLRESEFDFNFKPSNYIYFSFACSLCQHYICPTHVPLNIPKYHTFSPIFVRSSTKIYLSAFQFKAKYLLFLSHLLPNRSFFQIFHSANFWLLQKLFPCFTMVETVDSMFGNSEASRYTNKVLDLHRSSANFSTAYTSRHKVSWRDYLWFLHKFWYLIDII